MTTDARLDAMAEALASMDPYAEAALARGVGQDMVTWLRSVGGMSRLTNRMNRTNGLAYGSLEEFVLREGTTYAPPKVARPKGLRKGTNKMCFRNALYVAEDRGWTYVEGFAAGLIPVHHAWCLDKDGTVVETTWAEPGHSYMGVPIDVDTAWLAVALSGTFSVLSDWEHNYPILQKPYDADDYRMRLEFMRAERRTK